MGFISKDNYTSCFKFSDKFLHMMLGFSLFVFIGFYTQWSKLWVFVVAMAIGIGFEIIQGLSKKYLNKTDGFSGRDVTADFAGCILGIAWVTNPRNLMVHAVILLLYIFWEGIPKLRGQR